MSVKFYRILSGQNSGVLSGQLRQASYVERRKNYYQILGVERTSTHDEIKRAFVKKTHELHPDITTASSKADSRVRWSRKSQTEQFMDVKEAYDILRKPDKRREYDNVMFITSESGYLHEATVPRRKPPDIIELNKVRASNYMGPGKKLESNKHFINPEEEFEKERKKNRLLVVIGVTVAVLVLSNIGYVGYIHKTGQRRI